MLTIKLTDELQAKAKISTAEEALELFSNASTQSETIQTLTQEKETMTADFKILSDKLTALESKVAGMETASGVDADKIIADAKSAASQEVISAIAKVGGQAIRTEQAPKDVTSQTASDIQNADKTDADHAADYKASRNLQAEFITERSYVLFARANQGGFIRILERKNQ